MRRADVAHLYSEGTCRRFLRGHDFRLTALDLFPNPLERGGAVGDRIFGRFHIPTTPMDY
jgi:hypothetical protein